MRVWRPDCTQGQDARINLPHLLPTSFYITLLLFFSFYPPLVLSLQLTAELHSGMYWSFFTDCAVCCRLLSGTEAKRMIFLVFMPSFHANVLWFSCKINKSFAFPREWWKCKKCRVITFNKYANVGTFVICDATFWDYFTWFINLINTAATLQAWLCAWHTMLLLLNLVSCLILLSCSDPNSLFPWNGFAIKRHFIAFDEEAAKASETNGRISVTTGTEQQNAWSMGRENERGKCFTLVSSGAGSDHAEFGWRKEMSVSKGDFNWLSEWSRATHFITHHLKVTSPWPPTLY